MIEPGDAAYSLSTGSKVVARDGGTVGDDTVFRIDFGARDFTEVAALTMRTTGGQNFKAYVFINENAV